MFDCTKGLVSDNVAVAVVAVAVAAAVAAIVLCLHIFPLAFGL